MQGRCISVSLHFDEVPIFQNDIRVALQRGEMANTVVNGHTGRESDTCGGQTE